MKKIYIYIAISAFFYSCFGSDHSRAQKKPSPIAPMPSQPAAHPIEQHNHAVLMGTVGGTCCCCVCALATSICCPKQLAVRLFFSVIGGGIGTGATLGYVAPRKNTPVA